MSLEPGADDEEKSRDHHQRCKCPAGAPRNVYAG